MSSSADIIRDFTALYNQFAFEISIVRKAQILAQIVTDMRNLAGSLNKPELSDLATQITAELTTAGANAGTITTLLNAASNLISSTSPETKDDERKVKEIPTLAATGGVDQIDAENARVSREIERVRLLPQIITGERVLRTRLTYDDGIQTILTRRERRNNQIFMAKFNNPLDGIGGVGNQQPLPFEVGIPADNSLLDAARKNEEIRFSGKLFNSGAYIRKHVYPSSSMLELYNADMIRKTPIAQAWFSTRVDAVPPGGSFVFKQTNDLAPPSVLRSALENRLLFQNYVDHKWT